MEKELASDVLIAIKSGWDVHEVDKMFQRYYQHINKNQTYDVKLFNKVDHDHTKYLIKKLS